MYHKWMQLITVDAVDYVFGDLKVTDVIIFLSAVVFLLGVFRTISKFFKRKTAQDIERDKQYKKVLDQVNQYPTWRQQSIEKQVQFTSAIDNLSVKLSETNEKISDLRLTTDRRSATDNRYKIIRFNDEILKKEKHTKEHFDQILEAIHEYEIYCKQDEDYKNNKASFAIENIERVYQECLQNNDFL